MDASLGQFAAQGADAETRHRQPEGNPIRRLQVAGGQIETIADFRDLQPGATVGYWGIGTEDAPIVSFHFLRADIYSVEWTAR